MQESVSAAPRKAGIGAYVALVFAVIFFSGISVSKPVQDFGTVIAEKVGVEPKKVHDIFSVFDFNTLNGKFGKVAVPETADKAASGHGSANFSGQGGAGARDGFMFALTLMPTTLFAMGIIAVLEHYGALEAMRRLLQRILKPLMGIPGDTGLAMIASFQSTDAGAALTRALYDEGKINAQERDIFAMFQFSAGAPTAAAAVAGGEAEKVPTSIGACLAVIFIFKVVGANLMRFYLRLAARKEGAAS